MNAAGPPQGARPHAGGGGAGRHGGERTSRPDVLPRVNLLRRHLIDMPPVQAMESLLKQMEKSPSNQAFLDRMVVK